MKNYCLIGLGLFLILPTFMVYAYTCPDPETTSLAWGKPPEPWIVSPFSERSPQGEEGTRFLRANILVAGYGRGAVCTYRISVGDYTIWWPVITKIPAPVDYNWIDAPGGFICVKGLNECQFEAAPKN